MVKYPCGNPNCSKMIESKDSGSLAKAWCDECQKERTNRISLDKYYIRLSRGEYGNPWAKGGEK